MGRFLLVGRLAARNVRRRPAEAVLLLLAIAAAATTLSLGLVLHGLTDRPYETTRAATAGPDVVASVAPRPVGRNRVLPADPAVLEALADAPGVVNHSGPYPASVVELAADGVTAITWVQGRDPQEASVDQPQLTQGRWVEDGGAVVEAAFADTLGVGAGDRVTLNGRSFRVVGVAVTAAASYTHVCFGRLSCQVQIGPEPDLSQLGPPPDEPIVDEESVVVAGPPPLDDAGLVWLTRADARDLAPEDGALSYALNLKLADPAKAPAFVAAHSPEGRRDQLFLASWQDLRWTYGELVRNQREVLVTGGWLLAVLAVASVAVLVGGRMADQTRRVGLLKAIGGTPGLVAVVLLAEYIGLALVAAAAGLAIGRLAAPLLSDPAGLVGSAGAPSLTTSTVGLVTAAALGIAAIAALVPAVRAARTSTVHALADRARPPRRACWLIAFSARLPVPLLLGLRMIARRPRRALLGVASVVVTVSGIVAVLAARGTIAADWDGATGVESPDTDPANQVLLVITVMLVALAAVNAVVITWATALDARRFSALARALGATPAQVTMGLAAAQILPALTGAVLGILGGLGLWAALSNDEAGPPLWQLLAVVAGTMLIVAGLTSIPARLAARHPTAPILQAELT